MYEPHPQPLHCFDAKQTREEPSSSGAHAEICAEGCQVTGIPTATTLTQITEAKREAHAGVDYSPRHDVLCPLRWQKIEITRTTQWEENVRIRYHRYENGRCALKAMNISIESIEVDQ